MTSAIATRAAVGKRVGERGSREGAGAAVYEHSIGFAGDGRDNDIDVLVLVEVGERYAVTGVAAERLRRTERALVRVERIDDVQERDCSLPSAGGDHEIAEPVAVDIARGDGTAVDAGDALHRLRADRLRDAQRAAGGVIARYLIDRGGPCDCDGYRGEDVACNGAAAAQRDRHARAACERTQTARELRVIPRGRQDARRRSTGC